MNRAELRGRIQALAETAGMPYDMACARVVGRLLADTEALPVVERAIAELERIEEAGR